MDGIDEEIVDRFAELLPYRTFETVVRAEARMYEAEAHLYEFVVPMVPPSWNEPARVTERAEKLARSSGPTAVAVSTLDVASQRTRRRRTTTRTGD